MNVLEVALKLSKAAHTDDNAVSAVVDIEFRVVVDPAQGSLGQRKPILLHHRFDDRQCFECGIAEVALSVQTATCGSITVSALCRDILRLVLAGEDATSKGVVYDDLNTVALARGDQFGLDGTRCFGDR